MAFNPFSGTSANFYAVVAPLASGSDIITSVAGLVPVPVLEAVKYDFDFPLSSTAQFTGFNSPADTDTRVVFPRQLAGGVAPWTVNIEGAFSGDAVGTNSYTRFKQGQFLFFHLVLNKYVTGATFGFGFMGLTAKIIGISGGADTNSSEADPLRLQLRGDGLLYAPSTL